VVIPEIIEPEIVEPVEPVEQVSPVLSQISVPLDSLLTCLVDILQKMFRDQAKFQALFQL